MKRRSFPMAFAICLSLLAWSASGRAAAQSPSILLDETGRLSLHKARMAPLARFEVAPEG